MADTQNLDLIKASFMADTDCLAEVGYYTTGSTETKTYGNKQVTVTHYVWAGVTFTPINPVDGVYTFTLPLDPHGPNSGSAVSNYDTRYWGPVGELLTELGTVSGANVELKLKATRKEATAFCAAIDALESCNLKLRMAGSEADLGKEEGLDLLVADDALEAEGLYMKIRADKAWEDVRKSLTKLLSATIPVLASRSLTDRELLAFWRACQHQGDRAIQADEPIAQIYYSLKAFSASKTVTYNTTEGRLVIAGEDDDGNIVTPTGGTDQGLLYYTITRQRNFTFTVGGQNGPWYPLPLIADGKGGEREPEWRDQAMSSELDWCLQHELLLEFKGYSDTLADAEYNSKEFYDDEEQLPYLKKRTSKLTYALLAEKFKQEYPTETVPKAFMLSYTASKVPALWKSELYRCAFFAKTASCVDFPGVFGAPEAHARTDGPVDLDKAYPQECEHYKIALANSKAGTPGNKGGDFSWFLNFKWWWWLIIVLIVYIIYKFFTGNSDKRAAKEQGRQERKTMRLAAKLQSEQNLDQTEAAGPSKSINVKI